MCICAEYDYITPICHFLFLQTRTMELNSIISNKRTDGQNIIACYQKKIALLLKKKIKFKCNSLQSVVNQINFYQHLRNYNN